MVFLCLHIAPFQGGKDLLMVGSVDSQPVVLKFNPRDPRIPCAHLELQLGQRGIFATIFDGFGH